MDKELKASISRCQQNARKRKESIKEKPSKPVLRKPVAAVPQRSYLPTILTRVTPFFPLNRNDKTKNKKVEDLIIRNSYGTLILNGYRLSIYDEDIYLTILSEVKRTRSETITISKNQLCKLTGKVHSGRSYNLLMESLGRLSKTTVEFYTDKEEIHCVILTFKLTYETGRVVIKVSEHFLEILESGFYTFLNLTFRRSLKGDISKALYRFLSGQSDKKLTIGVKKLASIINLDMNKPLFRLGEKIKPALKELKNKGVLKDYFIKNGNVSIEK